MILLILGGLLFGNMVVQIHLIQNMKDNTAPMLAIFMEGINLASMEIIWGKDILGQMTRDP